jgi:hypothetical protein
MIDIILPAQNTWREYRYLMSGAVLFSPGLGLHRITRRCPPGGSAASPRHQPAALGVPGGNGGRWALRNTATAAASQRQ